MEPMKPVVSIVIPANNEEKYIERCLHSLKKQNFDLHYEIIVVDNGCNDDTIDICKRYGVKIVKEEKRGVAYARKRGFEATESDIIGSIDADTLVPSNWLREVYESLNNGGKAVGVFGPNILFDGNFIMNFVNFYVTRAFFPFSHYALGKTMLCGFNFACKKDAYVRAGKFDERTSGYEDLELAVRLKKIGKIVFNKDMRVKASIRRFKKDFPQYIRRGCENQLFLWIGKKVKITKDRAY